MRPPSARTVGGMLMGFAAALGLVLVVLGEWEALLRYAGLLGLLGLVGWAAYWAPYVEVDPAGVTLRNVWRTVRVPWPAVREVEGRYGLRLETLHGRITAWAASAPAGRDRMHGAESEEAVVVRRRLDALRGAGHLDRPHLERESLDATWHLRVLAAAAALTALAVAGQLVG